MAEDITHERSTLIEYTKWLIDTNTHGGHEVLVDTYLKTKHDTYEAPVTNLVVHRKLFPGC